MSKTTPADLKAAIAEVTAEQPEESTTVVGPIELSAEDKAKAIAFAAEIKSQLGDLATDPSTRPVLNAKAAAPAKGGAKLEDVLAKGYLPPVRTDLVSRDVRTPEQRERELSDLVAPNINFFPRGDMDNFRIERWAAALDHAQYSLEGSAAFMKWAPWETQYYSAVSRLEKAQNEFTAGQDGGYLAPQLWSNRFVDQIYASQALSRLPVTVMPMANGVVHVPKLTGAVTVNYAAENASLSANNTTFTQVSFTARKQAIFVQISNELIRDSDPSAASVIINNAQRWAAIDRDKQALIGNGQAGAPYGLLNAGGIGVTSSTLATPQVPLFTELLTGMGNVENLNNSTNVPVGQTTCTGVFGATALKTQILSTKDSQLRPIFDYGLNYFRGNNAPDASGSSMLDGLLGIPVFAFSNALGESAGSRHIIFGDWQHLWIMVRQDVELMTSAVAGTAFQNDQTWVRLIARYDVACVHPEAFFCYSNG